MVAEVAKQHFHHEDGVAELVVVVTVLCGVTSEEGAQ